MKFSTILCALGVGMLASCQKKAPLGRADADAARAAAAAARVKPALEPELAVKGLRLGDPVFIRAFKEERLLELFVRHPASGEFLLFKIYPIAASSGTLGPKLAEGDRQVPEGFYFVPPAAMNPNSRFHLSFNIGYPNEFDRAHQRTGSAIMIHGGRRSIGCQAMTDEKIEEIYTLCSAAHATGQKGFRVHIFPFRMTPERMREAAGNAHLPFWENLAEGYRFFETHRVPPDVSVAQGKYLISSEK
jgi:murein L,D-transpeptidase YafK